MYTVEMSFYSYWEHSYTERSEYLSRYKKENLNIIPYWKVDWHLNFSGFEPRIKAPLLEIIEWAKTKGKVLSFFIPLTPCPLVPEGGLPYHKKIPALDHRHMSMSVVKNEGELNHIHSGFDPQTPKLFFQWLQSLKDLCDKEQVGVHWWGLKSFYPHNVHFHSYLEDNSHAFAKAFSRFVEANDLGEGDNLIVEKDRFQSLFGEYYQASFEDILSDENFKVQEICFLKGSPETVFWQNLSPEDELSDLSLDYCRAHTYGMKPDFSLINTEKFNQDMWKFFEHISPLNTDYRQIYMENVRVGFQPLHLFRLWGEGSHAYIEEKANELKLTTFFFNFFRWSYLLQDQVSFLEDDEYEVTICLQESFTNEEVKKISKAFAQGHRVIFFQESFNEKQWRFWNNLIETNGYFKEEMIYQGKVHYYSNELGGQAVILSRMALSKLGVNPVVELWEKIIEFFDLDAFKIFHSEGVNYFWQRRDVRSHELNYKEVRRVFIHNTDKQKQRVHIKKIKNGSLIKVSERVQANVSADDDHIWIELGSMGMVNLEFGIIES